MVRRALAPLLRLGAPTATAAGLAILVCALAPASAATAAEPLIAPPTSRHIRHCDGRVGMRNAAFATRGFTVAAVLGAHPPAAALTCARARAVLTAGFAAIVGINYYKAGISVT